MEHMSPSFITIAREIVPMETEICSQQDSNVESCSQSCFDNSQNVQRTPIPSQNLPINELDIMSSQCSLDNEIFMETTPISTPKARKRKNLKAKNAQKRADMKRRRLDNPEYCINENKRRLEVFKDEIKDPETHEMYNKRQLALITKKLGDSVKRKEHNERQLTLITEKRENPDEREKHNKLELERITRESGKIQLER